MVLLTLPEYIANALNPARVISVYVSDTEKAARVVVPDNQLSLAIGKEGAERPPGRPSSPAGRSTSRARAEVRTGHRGSRGTGGASQAGGWRNECRRQRKIPMRMCVGCREMKPKRELTPGGEARRRETIAHRP